MLCSVDTPEYHMQRTAFARENRYSHSAIPPPAFLILIQVCTLVNTLLYTHIYVYFVYIRLNLFSFMYTHVTIVIFMYVLYPYMNLK